MFLLQNTFIEVTTPFEIYCKVIDTCLHDFNPVAPANCKKDRKSYSIYRFDFKIQILTQKQY